MKKFRLLLLIVVLLAADRSTSAESARAIHPHLVGVTTVALNFSPQTLPGLDAVALERDIRTALEKGGISIEPAAPVTLFITVTYQQITACPEFVAFRVYVALSEDVAVHRGSRTKTVYVNTWHESEEFIESTSQAGKVAHESVLGLIRYFVDSAQYTRSVRQKSSATLSEPAHAQPRDGRKDECDERSH